MGSRRRPRRRRRAVRRSPATVGTQLVTAAFAADAGTVDELASVEPPYYLFKVVDKTPSTITPLEEARPKITEALRTEKAKKAAAAEADAILAKARDGGTVAALEQAARAKGYEVEDTGAFGRSEPIPKIARAAQRTTCSR